MKYTALETSNKINVVSGDSIRKTHRTISHTILRQNDHDSYLLHGRHSPFPPPPLLVLLLLVGRSLVHPFHRPSTFLPSTPPYLILFYLFIFFFLQNNSISVVDCGRYEERDLTKDGFHGNYPWWMTEPVSLAPRNDLCVAREWQSEAERLNAHEHQNAPHHRVGLFFFFFFPAPPNA